MTYYTRMDSPIGPLLLVSNGAALTGLYMEATAHGPIVTDEWKRDDSAAPFARTREQLVAYFAGKRTHFDVPLELEGTPFQRSVWAEPCVFRTAVSSPTDGLPRGSASRVLQGRSVSPTGGIPSRSLSRVTA